MDRTTFLRIIIFIMFLLIGGLVGGLVGNHKKVDLSKKSVIEECKEGICPEPENWKGDKK
ncbi:MAG: hypothetical protein MUP69_10335 [Candidatus Atribacteria bacterium]|nr:hypothetical protein [Candidatus Atribacteria bacterium]